MTKFSPEYLNPADDLLKQFALTGDDSLSAILNKNNIATFQTQYAGGRVRRFPPVKTLTLFMHQVASCNKSCRNTLIASASARDQIATGQNPDKTDNSAYCKARHRLTEASIKTLLTQSGENLDGASPETWRWHDRRVVITDGSTLPMPDTNENQQAYPQHGSQKRGWISHPPDRDIGHVRQWSLTGISRGSLPRKKNRRNGSVPQAAEISKRRRHFAGSRHF